MKHLSNHMVNMLLDGFNVDVLPETGKGNGTITMFLGEEMFEELAAQSGLITIEVEAA